jgi:hypothetical protein
MWQRLFLMMATLLLAGALSAPALAAKPPKAKTPEEQKFDFEGDTIETDFLKPNGGVIGSVIIEERKSLIKIRMDFVDEIVQSAEEL